MIDNLILAVGIIIIAGFFGGKFAGRIGFPRITGYIMVGIILSPSLLNIVAKARIEDLNIFTSIALGIIAYSIGGRLKWETIRVQEKSILIIGLTQAIGAWILSMLAVTLLTPFFFDMPGAGFSDTYFPMGLVIGALASATAPAVILALIREYRARGTLTTTLLSVVALDDALAIIFFSIALGIAQPLSLGEASSLNQMLLLPALRILGSVAIGTILGFALVGIARYIQSPALLLVTILGTIMVCIGITELLEMPEILANMVIGFIVINKVKRDEMLNVIDNIEDVVFTVFFVLTGLHFNLDVIKVAGILALIIVFSRFSGKYLGTMIGATVARSPKPVRNYLGLALLPKAGVTLGLALLAQEAIPAFGGLVYNSILASVIVNELFAPPLVKYAIFKAGEQNAD